ncbi:MAG: putative sporulation protein YtxC [Clostridia bacterium]|nr:putative sporulation protein YtxC [Clostridia bacterium]
MLKSFCIKTNNHQIVNYLLNEFQKVKLENLYISKSKFKLYNNFIVHYKGEDLDCFYNIFYDIISSVIINFYEKDIVKHIINCNYFYFNDIEQRKIFEIANDYLYSENSEDLIIRKSSIIISCIEYFANNKSVILDGFVNFRIKDYMKIIDYIVDLAVNKFVIDKEYTEFIDLLKCYINSKDFGISSVHLIYQSQESILLDELKNTITLDNSILNNKYLSDISFSSNDYTLNTLLTLLPKKIYIHIIDCIEDEFINTIKLIFDNRVYICTDCNICKSYRLKKINK